MFEGFEGSTASLGVLDFCGRSAAQQILLRSHPTKDRKTEAAGRGETRENRFESVKVNGDGKIVIEEGEEQQEKTGNELTARISETQLLQLLLKVQLSTVGLKIAIASFSPGEAVVEARTIWGALA